MKFTRTTPYLLLAVAFIASGCATHAGEGALIGGASGAGIGGLIGSLSHGRAGEGAAIGAAVGALSGALIGREMDNQERIRALEAQQGQVYRPAPRYEYHYREYVAPPPPPPPPPPVGYYEYRSYSRDGCGYRYEYRETRRYYP